MSEDAVLVKTDQLPIGSRLSHPINDSEERLLLAAGVLLTERLKERLLARGITEVLLHPDDVAALFGGDSQDTETTAAKSKKTKKKTSKQKPTASNLQTQLRETVVRVKMQASALGASVSRRIHVVEPPLSERQVKHGAEPYDAEQQKRLVQHFSVATQVLDTLARQAINGRVHDDQPLRMITEEYVDELTADTDSVLASSSELAPDPAITERGIRLSLLGMAMAIEVGWDEPHVREVGLCGLIHDFGVFVLGEELRDHQRSMAAAEYRQLEDHPLLTLDLLTTMKMVSLPVRLAATQVHENPDGSGYPLGIQGEQIHPYASLLHAADAYITLTANTGGRKAYLSYDVMVYLLNQVKAKRMDEQAVRALLQVVSLFPIGSRVRLSDGTEAQVIRRNGLNYTAPIVARVGSDRKLRTDDKHRSIVDLQKAKMRVMTPLTPPDRAEQRLDESLLSEVLWEGATAESQ